MRHVSRRSLNHTPEIVSLCLFSFFLSSQQSASKAATCYMAAAPSQEYASKMSTSVFHAQKMCLFGSLLYFWCPAVILEEITFLTFVCVKILHTKAGLGYLKYYRTIFWLCHDTWCIAINSYSQMLGLDDKIQEYDIFHSILVFLTHY